MSCHSRQTTPIKLCLMSATIQIFAHFYVPRQCSKPNDAILTKLANNSCLVCYTICPTSTAMQLGHSFAYKAFLVVCLCLCVCVSGGVEVISHWRNLFGNREINLHHLFLSHSPYSKVVTADGISRSQPSPCHSRQFGQCILEVHMCALRSALKNVPIYIFFKFLSHQVLVLSGTHNSQPSDLWANT